MNANMQACGYALGYGGGRAYSTRRAGRKRQNAIVRFRYFFLGLLVALLTSNVWAQSIVTRVGRDSILVGDSLSVWIKVQAQRGADIIFNEIPEQLSPGVELYAQPVIDTLQYDSAGYASRLHLLVTSYDSGWQAIPRVPVLVRYSGRVDTLYSESGLIYVDFVPRDTAYADIKPIVGPLQQGITWREVYPWLLLGGGVLLLCLAGFLLWRWFRHREEKVESRVPTLPPDVVALQQLRALRQESAWRSRGAKEFFSTITDAVRTYLEAVWGVRAMEETTDNILEQLKVEERCKPEWRNELRGVLQMADLAKFAKHKPLENECIGALDSAITLVEDIAAEETKSQQRVQPTAEETPRAEEPLAG